MAVSQSLALAIEPTSRRTRASVVRPTALVAVIDADKAAASANVAATALADAIDPDRACRPLICPVTALDEARLAASGRVRVSSVATALTG